MRRALVDVIYCQYFQKLSYLLLLIRLLLFHLLTLITSNAVLSCGNLKDHFRTNPRLNYIQTPEAQKAN